METDGQLELCVAQVRGQLARLAEERYRAFSARLLPPGTRLIGVRLPRLRHLAREIAGGDWRAYLEAAGKDTFEEVMLQGMVIGCAACNCEERLRRVRGFLPLIDNWSVCDSFCAGLKFTRAHKAEVWSFLESYFSSKREYSVRFACVMLLDYYVEEADLARDLAVLDRLSGQPYYAMMAVAWAISILYIRYPHAVSAYLLESNLDDVTYQKALQKIMESQQVGAAAKARIRALRQRRASQRGEGGTAPLCGGR